MYKNLEKEALALGIKRFTVRAMMIDNKNHILLLQRAFNDSMPGIYELPGGSVDHNETLDQALKREVLEETGINIDQINNYLGHYDYKSKRANAFTRQFNFVTKIAQEYEVKISNEHNDFKWIHLDMVKTVQLPVNEVIFGLIDQYKKLF